MSEITVLFNTKKEPVRENIQRELLWYDGLKKELLTFHGGQLVFEYKEDNYLVGMKLDERIKKGITTTYRLLPKVKDLEVVNYSKTKTITNEEKVKKWFDNYINYNDTNVSVISLDKQGMLVNIPEKEIDDFLYQAERNGFLIRR